MYVNLDRSLIEEVKATIFDSSHLSYCKMGNFGIRSKKKRGERECNAYNCVHAIQDRIGDLVDHCNSLNVERSAEGVFALCDLFNYGQTLIDCIEKLADIYGTTCEAGKGCSIFQEPGIDGKGNDARYFKYIRSLCSVHPVDTTGHKEYQGDHLEWCPYVVATVGALYDAMLGDFPDNERPDFRATVYTEPVGRVKDINIYIAQIFRYIKVRYQELEQINTAIIKYNHEKIAEYCSTPIKQPEEYPTYVDYLQNIYIEMGSRVGTYQYKVKEWAAILQTHFSDTILEEWLEMYQRELMERIKRIHADLQTMKCAENDWDSDLFEYRMLVSKTKYRYDSSKMVALYSVYESDDKASWDFSFMDEHPYFEYTELEEILGIIDSAKKENYSEQEMSELIRKLGRSCDNSSIWARCQLKLMEEKFEGCPPFDYAQNDWHLWLQFRLCEWMCEKMSVTSN